MKPAWASGGRTGQIRRFMGLAVFACEGMVVVIDEREGEDEDCSIVSISEMLERIRTLKRPYRNKTKAQLSVEQRRFYDQRRRGIENVYECCREARNMGDPTDPRVQAFWAKHSRRSRVATTPPRNDPAGYPVLPTLPRGRDIGTTVRPDGTYGGPTLYQPPRRKSKLA